MKKIIVVVFLFCVLLTGCSSSEVGFEPITLEEYKTLIANKESFVVEQWGTSCVHCSGLKPKLQKFVKEYNLTIKTINLDKLTVDERKELESITGTLATPIIMFYKEGTEKSIATRIVGDVSYEKLVNKFKDNGIIE